ncbi:MAG: recombinase family protein, partial [Deltaproteobacteria bacterium]|nr:recombinase family protein [Deltaproteobacteria bacterium]
MRDEKQPDTAGISSECEGARLRAVQYLRMSTDNQSYSLLNQASAIARYAEARAIDIVETFEDAGRSGLTFATRPGLMRLIARVQSGTLAAHCVLVYDVSRWGRFQDVDESAHLEFICRSAGVEVVYCAEPFAEADVQTAAVIKALKRIMAAEYSRELSRKVWLGQ